MTDAKKRLVLAITLAEPGGAQTFVLGFAHWLKQQGHDVTIVAGDGQWLFDEAKKNGIPTRRVASLGRAINPVRDWLAYRELTRVFSELKPTAVHLNSTKMGVLGSLAATRLPGYQTTHSPRIVYRIGGWVFLEPLSTLRKYVYLFAERWSAKLKDTIICVHPGDAEVAARVGIRPKGTIVTVPNGIDLPAFEANLQSHDDARRVLDLMDDQIVFGTIAGLYPAKNIIGYLESCAIVYRAMPNARFVIMGDGPDRQKIEAERQRRGLTASVMLTGNINNAKSLLRGCDAFVLPSVKEGMPWALLEAMAAGLPCVATDVGANRWMLGDDGGWIVPKHDPRALADAMIEAAQNQTEAARRGKKAKEIVQERFPLAKTYEGNWMATEPSL